MRIAVNARFLLPGKLEGLGWYSHEVLQRMVRQHPEDQFIFLFDRPFDPAFIYGPNVEPVALFPPARHPLLWYWWFEWAVPAALKRQRAEVFFSPDSYLSLRSNVPTVLTVHDLFPLQFPKQVPWWARDYYRYFFPRYLRRADRLVAISEFVRQSVVEQTGIPEKDISVVYNGPRSGFSPLDEADRCQLREQFSAGQLYFFYSGAIHPRKNIPRLIRAFDTFKIRSGAPVRLLLAGRFAWETGPVLSAWEQAKHRADIQFLGYVPDADLQRLTAAALALVNVSMMEGFGLPLLEAMQAETPVICSNVTAFPEVAGPAALLVDPHSELEIAAALERVYTDPLLCKQLVSAGRMQRQKFNWDTAAAQLYALIRSAAGHPETA